MKTSLRKIKGLLSKYKGFEVSPELDRKVLKAIDNLHVEHDFTDSVRVVKSPSFFANINQIFIKKLKRYAVIAVLILIAVTGTMYFNQNSYAYHLNKAGFALNKLDALLHGSRNQASLIPNAFADETSANDTDANASDENQIIILVLEVDHETQAAIESAEQLSDINKLRNALNAIYVFQIREVDVLSDAVEAVSGQETTVKLTNVLVSSSDQQKLVSKALKFVKDSSDKGDRQVNIDIETDNDKNISSDKKESEKKVFRLADVKNQYDNAKETFEEVKKLGAEDKDIENLEGKLDKAETALEEGNLGRAHGLSTATEVKGRNIIRKAEKLTEKESDEDGKDKTNSKNYIDAQSKSDENPNKLSKDGNEDIKLEKTPVKESNNDKKPKLNLSGSERNDSGKSDSED